MMKGKQLKGSIALTTVLIATSVLMILGMALLSNTIDLTNTGKAYSNEYVLDTLQQSALEEGLYELVADNTYIGNFSYQVNGNTCNIGISNTLLPQIKEVAVECTYDGYTGRMTKKVDTSSSPYTISN